MSVQERKTSGVEVLRLYLFQPTMPHQNIIPNYANIKIPVTSPASRVTQDKIRTTRIKAEIKFLYMKKEKLNKELALIMN